MEELFPLKKHPFTLTLLHSKSPNSKKAKLQKGQNWSFGLFGCNRPRVKHIEVGITGLYSKGLKRTTGTFNKMV